MDSLHSSESGSITPINELRRQLVVDERLEPPKETEDEAGLPPAEVRPVDDVSKDFES
jgi:hypothetical protein